MGVFVFLPLVLPLTALPIARLAGLHLHPRTAARLLTALSVVMGVCSTLCLGLLGVIGTAQIPGNPLPDSWSAPEVRDVVPFHEAVGFGSIALLCAVAVACGATLVRHLRVRRRLRHALAAVPHERDVAVLPDRTPYAYALPGRPGRVVASTAMAAGLAPDEYRALLAHERAHLTHRHHRILLATRLASRVNPFLRPLQAAVAFGAERWADEEAAEAVGDRRLTARAVANAALLTHRAGGPHTPPGLAAFAAPGPVPRRVAALLGPVPAAGGWPPAHSPAGLAAMVAAAGTAASALSAVNAAVALLLVLKAATPL
ncbi:membrane protein [Kitasatospora indigofera]|uniref:Membrane protein n=1 Tax=Kitasatospora indigofera TaxID=67307 RepID=A0A919FL21_9ACTN|nr:M56 family metallopeptidase [Kitasatospora indigofera]GHH67414.1 membrane protein [Kitasatospora indigofera]